MCWVSWAYRPIGLTAFWFLEGVLKLGSECLASIMLLAASGVKLV